MLRFSSVHYSVLPKRAVEGRPFSGWITPSGPRCGALPVRFWGGSTARSVGATAAPAAPAAGTAARVAGTGWRRLPALHRRLDLGGAAGLHCVLLFAGLARVPPLSSLSYRARRSLPALVALRRDRCCRRRVRRGGSTAAPAGCWIGTAPRWALRKGEADCGAAIAGPGEAASGTGR